ncbi:amidohydrolase [Streptomyces fuscigenes]|uniref:amidohydrolase n=1 Tax=Streptomyces fuscigenes TaxID=1528880 RepID=UPI001F3927CE|nr:amidohydrolase [Streptomyces fuscigenes]MCF3965341.1 amidohydrolase [Streptomyces fuscigenes]
MIETASLVDQYCHGVLRTELGLGTFETHLADAGGPPAPGTTFFDTQTGFAVRRWCPPLLGLEPHCPPARYLARRRELGVAAAARLLLRGTGVTTYLVDTGLPGDLTGPEELASAGGARAREIVRLDLLAQQVADTSGSAGALLANLAESVSSAATTAVAFACASVPAVDPASPPSPREAHAAAVHWLGSRATGDPPSDPVLLRHLLWTAVATGRPLQLHLSRTEPQRLAGFAAATEGHGVHLVLLGSYPHHRQAARLTATFPHVYADLGPALTRTGARAAALLAEVLETAPFGKLLFSSGGRGLPELHVVGARVFTEALSRVLGGWVADGAWSLTDARRVSSLIASENATRVYDL